MSSSLERSWIKANVGVALALLTLGMAQAAEPALAVVTELDQLPSYDERGKVPVVASVDQFKANLRAATEQAATKQPARLLREGDLRWVNFQWQLNRMAQAKQPMPDLSEFGWELRPDGSYVLDVANNPQWGLWYRALSDFGEPELFGLRAQRLLERGFRNEDIETLQLYLQKTHPKQSELKAEQRLVETVRGHHRKKIGTTRIALADWASYAYQFDCVRERAKQRWAAGLLERLDNHRQRILISYFQEISGSIAFLPDANFDQSLNQFTQAMVSGAVEQQLQQQEKEVAR